MKQVALWLGLLIVGFGGGWVVKGWQVHASEVAQVKAANDSLKTQMGDMMARMAAQTVATDAANAQTEAILAAAQQRLGEQHDAFKKISVDIARVASGHCSFNAAADRLYQRAYDAAFVPGATEAGKAGGADAAHHQAGTAPADQRAASGPAGQPERAQLQPDG